MSSERAKATHPLVAICNTLCCLAALACLITGIVFLASPAKAGLESEEQAEFIGTILTAIGGTIIGLQVLCVLAICCCGATAICASLCSQA